jgi:hypothetical protein
MKKLCISELKLIIELVRIAKTDGERRLWMHKQKKKVRCGWYKTVNRIVAKYKPPF